MTFPVRTRASRLVLIPQRILQLVLTSAANPAVNLSTGPAYTMTVQPYQEDGTPVSGIVTFTSSAPGVCAIDPVTGATTRVGAGSAVLTAQDAGGAFVQTTITVAVPVTVTQLLATPTSQLAAAGSVVNQRITPATAAGSSVSGRTITAVSADPTIGTVGAPTGDPDHDFPVTAVAEGGPIVITYRDQAANVQVDVPFTVVPASTLHPFEPPGLTPVFEMQFSSQLAPNQTQILGSPSSQYGLLRGSFQRTAKTLAEGGLWNNQLVHDPTSPSPSGYFFRVNYGAGLGDTAAQPGGGQPGLLNLWDQNGWNTGAEHGQTTWYEETWIRIGDPVTKDFEMHPVSLKNFGYIYGGDSKALRRTGLLIGGSVNNTGLQKLVGGFGHSFGVNTLVEEWGLTGQSPRDIVDYDQNMNLSKALTCGDWHHVVRLITANTVNVANGSIRTYIDSVLTHSYDNLLWRTTAFPHAWSSPRHWNITWGGGGGFHKTRDDNIDFAYFYASAA